METKHSQFVISERLDIAEKTQRAIEHMLEYIAYKVPVLMLCQHKNRKSNKNVSIYIAIILNSNQINQFCLALDLLVQFEPLGCKAVQYGGISSGFNFAHLDDCIHSSSK